MQFNSLAYFAFLSISVLVYYRLPFRAQNLWLLALSYGFYAFWDWRFLGLMVFATGIGYYPSLFIEQARERQDETAARRWMQASVAASLVVLGFFKYFDFFLGSFGRMLSRLGMTTPAHTLGIILPVGISFYVFHTISYVVDVYRRDIRATRLFSELALFIAFFPQLVAGPIARASSLLPQCQSPRVVTPEKVRDGFWLILLGLFRKVAIADTAGALANQTFGSPDQHNSIQLLMGLLLYTLQIYGDFCGYSNIARGSASLFGFRLIRNFRHPYFASNISDFWRRWHISLSSWLRDYLYIPLGGNRKGKVRTYVNLMITMVLGGLWHGASWNFVTWGTLHGLYLSGYHFYSSLLARGQQAVAESRFVAALGGCAVFALVSLNWVFFRSSDFSASLHYLHGIAGRGMSGSRPWLLATILLYGLMALIDVPQAMLNDELCFSRWSPFPKSLTITGLILATLFGGNLAAQAFIYFQF